MLPALLAAASAMTGCRPDGSAPAPRPAVWAIEGQLQGKTKRSGEVEPATDISGLACAPEVSGSRLCMIADDESQGAQIVMLSEGKLIAGEFIPLIADDHAGKPIELDAEAVSYADGAFYVIGSHGRARHEVDGEKEARNEAKARASRRVFRIWLDPAGVGEDGRLLAGAEPRIDRSEALSDLFQAHPELKAAFDQPLDANGLTIEGLAVQGDIMTIGFRGPVAGDEALLLAVPIGAVFDGETARGTLMRVKLGTDTAGGVRGVRDLAVFDGGFIGIAGPVVDTPERPIADGDFAVFYWRPGEAARCQSLAASHDPQNDGAKPLKPEGLTLLAPDDNGPRALITFDGPGVYPSPIRLTPGQASPCG